MNETRPFAPMTLTCPDCGEEWEGIALWAGGDVSCSPCGRRANEERMAAIRESRAYTVREIGGMMPTQAEGRFSNGRPYYFRARHGDWSLSVGEPDWPDNYSKWPREDGWGETVGQGDDPSHGCMEDAEVLAILDAYDAANPA